MDGGEGEGGGSGNIGVDGRMGNRTPPPDPVEREHRLDVGDDGRSMLQVAGQVAAGLLSSNASSISQMQGGGGGHTSNGMPPHWQVPARPPPPAPLALIRAILTISLLTLIPAISTALYKPARGVVFGYHKVAYYLVLSAILASGLVEAITAFWISRPGGGSGRRLSFGRAVLFASIFPFAAGLGIAGYGFFAQG